jgi:hypothetical protein
LGIDVTFKRIFVSAETFGMIDKVSEITSSTAPAAAPDTVDLFQQAFEAFEESTAYKTNPGALDKELRAIAEEMGAQSAATAAQKFMVTLPMKLVNSIKQLLSQQ